MDRAEIEQLIGLMKENGVTELSLETPEFKISLKRLPGADEIAAPGADEIAAPGADEIAAPGPPGEVVPVEATEEAPAAYDSVEAVRMREPAPIISPVVGIFHNGGMLDPRRLLAEGDQVEEGELLAAVESMKIPNELRSPFAGKVSKVLARDGDPVQYGQALFLIQPEEVKAHEAPYT